MLDASNGAAAHDHVLIPLGGGVAVAKIPDWVVVASFAGTLGLTVSLIGAAILRRRGKILIRELSRSEARFQDIAEVAGDWIWEMDAELRFTYISNRMYDLTGVARGACLGKTRAELAGDPIMTEPWRAHLDDLENHRPFRDFEYSTLFAHGQIRHFRVSGKPVFDERGAFAGYRGMGADITEVTEALSAQRNSEEVFRSIVDNSSAAIVLKGLDGRFQLVNKRFQEWYGVSQDHVIGKTTDEVYPSGYADEFAAHDREVMERRIATQQENLAPFADGSEHILSITRFPVFDADGVLTGIGVINVDITEQKQVEQDIAEKTALLQTIFDSAPIALSLRDATGRFMFVNKRQSIEMGGQPVDYIGKTAAGTYGAIAGKAVDALVMEVLESKNPVLEREIRPSRRSGRVYRYSAIPLFEDSGDIASVLTIGQNVTTQKESEDAIRQSEALLQTILDAVPASISYRDAAGRFVFVNKRLAAQIDVPPEDYIGKSLFEARGPVPGDSVAKLVAEVLETKQSIIDREMNLTLRSGRLHRYSAVPVFDDIGDVSGVLAIGQDVTAQKEAEDAVRKSEALLQTILDATPAFIAYRDAAGRYVFVNKRLADHLGGETSGFIGKTREEVHGPVSGESVETMVAAVLASKQPIVEREFRPPRLPGHVFRYSVVPVLDDGGGVSGVLAIGQDVTAQKETEDAVRQSEALLRSVIDYSPTVISLKDLNRRFLLVNKAFLAAFDKTLEQVIGELDDTVMVLNHSEAKLSHEDEVIRTGEAIAQERVETLPSGETYHRLMTKFPVRNADGEIVAVGSIGADLGELRRVEEDLQQLEARFSEILRIAPEGIISADPSGKILVFNDAAENLFGYERDQMIGQSLDILLPEIVRGDHGRYLKAFIDGSESARMMGGRGEISGRRRDGSVFPAEASISKLQTGGQTILTVTMHDITERKETDDMLQLALHEAQQADKAKQNFLASMSHELRTPLNAIMGFSEMIELEVFGSVGNDRYGEYIHDISASAKHLLALVNDMLDIAKIEAGKLDLDMEYIDLAEVATEAVRELSIQIEQKGLNFGGVTDRYRETVYADSRAVRQILVNLLTNAVKFTPDGGGMGVSISPSEGDFVHILVWDTGVGIAEDDLEKVLSPFTQTGDIQVAREGGTGLGLAIVKSLVELHGGWITVESAIGEGVRVHVYLPNVMRAA
ncbi:MAG: PAS domain-containing protein [Rhodospirillaceae bacterium]|nr:PAS domain-containing protein [Rhodospirillaceae bacterium]MBT5666591.1 PAS domain-containing protein [Rhodospirillaceae bacterium]